MTIADINEIRQGVADFARKAGISQVEAACESCLVLATVLASVEKGLSVDEAVETGVQLFVSRWGEVFE